MQTLHRLFKWLGFLALGCYILVAIALLGLRYWVAPNIDRWREPLQRELSAMLSMPVQMEALEAEWHWKGPRILVHNARLHDDDGHQLLEIPLLDVSLAWPDVVLRAPRFRSLRADGVELLIQRDHEERISMLGYELEDDDEGDGIDTIHDFEIIHWLLSQGDVLLTNARIRWLDEARGAPPLDLTEVALGFSADNGGFRFSMRAAPPADLGRSFAMQGEIQAADFKGNALLMEDVSGLFHVDVDGMRPASWQPWFDVHTYLQDGQVRWQGWQEVTRGAPGRHVSVVSVEDGRWALADVAQFAASSAQLYVSGPWSAIRGLWSVDTPPANDPVRLAMRAEGLSVNAPEHLDESLYFDHVAFSTDARRDEDLGFQLHADLLQLRNADMDLGLHGKWQQHGGGEAGLIALDGHFHRAELAAIVRYLPLLVDEEARDWMRHGLLAGRLTDAPVKLHGDLAHFPYGDHPEKGDFEVGGPVHEVVIDYAPAALVGDPGWPRLEGLNGRARLHRVDLQIHADAMQMRPEGQPITLTDVNAQIANIEEDSVLEVQGLGTAQAEAVLALLRSSPLGSLLDDAFHLARGEGEWQVPLSLTIPLADTDDMRVAGAVVFQKAALQLAHTIPAFSGLEGRIAFTETELSAEDLKGRVLGGPVSISGGIGPKQPGLTFAGRLRADALKEVLGSRFEGMLEGAMAYRLSVQRSPNGEYDLRFESPLEGLAIALPAPLGKAQAERRSFRAHWSDPRGGNAVLDLRYGDALTAQFVHREGANDPTFFHSGVVNLNGSAKRGASGLSVDVSIPRIDLDAWRELDDWSDEQGEAGGRTLPPLNDLRLQAESARVFGTTLDHLTFTMKQAEGQRWRLDVSSTQTAGTVFWREGQGRIQGDVEAKFERLALGSAESGESAKNPETKTSDSETMLAADTDVNIPAIRLNVDRLRLYGREAGTLSLVGVNETQGRRWNLKQLELRSPNGVVKGQGVWQLDGAQRGLRLDATAQLEDLGAWLESAGFKDVMEGGKGSVNGHIEWRGIPWRFDRARLSGELDVDLSDGRFISVSSRSARLLELLSLQSVKRLASLEWNPAGLMKQGFPFDSLGGRLTMADGIVHSENYRVAGPVATIAIAGDVDLPREMLDLYAVVVPTLDVSGAAIAAGIAVNPIVGLGAFLTQWLLKSPLSKAMAVEYRVRGAFDTPKIEEISTKEIQSESAGSASR